MSLRIRHLPWFLPAILAFAADSPGRAAAPQLAHMVYFTLNDSSDAAREKLVAACTKYLSGHEGTVHFSVGKRAVEFNRDVNDKEFDVALHLVFESKAAHDQYQSHPRHQAFIDENATSWAKVRVFDSYLAAPAPASR
jgi:hypothetical protein